MATNDVHNAHSVLTICCLDCSRNTNLWTLTFSDGTTEIACNECLGDWFKYQLDGYADITKVEPYSHASWYSYALSQAH